MDRKKTEAQDEATTKRENQVRVSAWKTTDGEVFTERGKAREHQKEIDRKKNLALCIHALLAEGIVNGRLEMDEAQVVDAMVQGREAVLEALK